MTNNKKYYSLEEAKEKLSKKIEEQAIILKNDLKRKREEREKEFGKEKETCFYRKAKKVFEEMKDGPEKLDFAIKLKRIIELEREIEKRRKEK